MRSSAAVVDGVVYCGSFDGSKCALNANMGAEIWSIKVGGKIWSSPAVANGRDIYDWSKPMWATQFLIVISLYIAWLLLL